MNRKWIVAVVSVLAVALAMFPAVRSARTAHGMDAQRAVCRRPGRIPQGCRKYGIPYPHRAPGSHSA